MKKLPALAGLVVLSFFSAQPGFAQQKTIAEINALRKDIEALKQGQTAIQKELLEIKNLLLQKELQAAREALQGRQVPAPAQAQGPSPAQPRVAVVSVADAPFNGEKSAKLTLIDFTDYQ